METRALDLDSDKVTSSQFCQLMTSLSSFFSFVHIFLWNVDMSVLLPLRTWKFHHIIEWATNDFFYSSSTIQCKISQWMQVTSYGVYNHAIFPHANPKCWETLSTRPNIKKFHKRACPYLFSLTFCCSILQIWRMTLFR